MQLNCRHENHPYPDQPRSGDAAGKLRRALGLRADDQLIAETTPEDLLLRPAVTLPVEMYSEKRIREFDEAETELAKVLTRRSRPKKSAR